MADKLNIPYHQDAGHGWLEVSRNLLQELGIEATISCFSYASGNRVFLEEDSDAAKLINALKAAGRDFHLEDRDCGNWAFVRNFPSYTH